MPVTNVSPNVDNYFIGKGIVKWKETSPNTDVAFRDIGNVPTFELTPSLDILDHFSSRSGIRSKDKSVVRQQGLTLRMIMEELTADNLRLMLMGDDVTGSSSPLTFNILGSAEIEGAIRFVGTNDVGAKIQVDLPKVSIKPNAAFSPISDEWGNMELNGEVLLSGGIFGTINWDISAEITS